MGENAVSEVWKQGAEARLYRTSFLGKPAIVKERFTKTYRHPVLDKSLTSQRTKSEVRNMMRCRQNGIYTPCIYHVDLDSYKIYMEYMEDSVTVKDYVMKIQADQTHNHTDADQTHNHTDALRPLAETIGAVLATMHKNNIIHGDLTTSNMLLKGDPSDMKLYLIDFGLGSVVQNVNEEKGVDLYVLERAFLSTHPDTEEVFDIIVQSYSKNYGKGAQAVIAKLDEVRMRGRKRTMVG